MKVMRPTITVESTDAASHSRQTTVTWTNVAGVEIHGDNPTNHGGSGTGPDGFDLLGAALGQCLLNTLIANAERDGIMLRGARATVAIKSKAPRVGEAPYISDFLVDVYLDGDLDEDQRADLEQGMATLCGVRETLMRTPAIVERVHVGMDSGPPGHAA
jgi:uncharacterized OsmC-like protein